MRKKNLKLDGMGLEAIEGAGDSLTIKLTGYRDTKAGTHEEYKIEAQVCRYSVLQLLRQVREMHERDVERIESERKRIEQEKRALG